MCRLTPGWSLAIAHLVLAHLVLARVNGQPPGIDRVRAAECFAAAEARGRADGGRL